MAVESIAMETMAVESTAMLRTHSPPSYDGYGKLLLTTHTCDVLPARTLWPSTPTARRARSPLRDASAKAACRLRAHSPSRRPRRPRASRPRRHGAAHPRASSRSGSRCWVRGQSEGGLPGDTHYIMYKGNSCTNLSSVVILCKEHNDESRSCSRDLAYGMSVSPTPPPRVSDCLLIFFNAGAI